MKIVFTSHYAIPHVGGVEIVVDRLARELTQLGHDVTHVASKSTPGAGAEPLPYEQILVPAWQGLLERAAVPYPFFAPRALGRALRTALAGADVVHAHGLLYQSGAHAFARRRGQRPVRVLTEHVGHVAYDSRMLDVTERIAIGTLGRWMVRRADAVVVLNGRVEDEIRRLDPAVRIEHIDNGVDFTRFHPANEDERRTLREELGWDAGTPHVLFVGRLVEKKGVRIAIEAARLARGAFQLVLVGPGTATDLPSNVTHLGVRTPGEVARLYRAADLFLLPSWGEGFPLTAQEAMASALPVILGDDPAYASVLRGTDAVTLVARDAASVAEATMRVLSRAREAGNAALRFAQSRFSWSRTAALHLELYERLLHERLQRA